MTHDRKAGGGASPLPGESEKEYLDRQIAEAKLALGSTLESMKGEAKTLASPTAWTREHPWAALAASAAAGAAAAMFLAPRRGESMKERWYKIKVELAGDGAGTAAAEAEPVKKRSLLGIAAGAAFGLLKPVALELLRSMNEARAAGEPAVSDAPAGMPGQEGPP